jgi:hypothetical protein
MLVVVDVSSGGLVARDVTWSQPVRGCGVDEGWGKVEWPQGFDEEFLQGTGLAAEEGAGLGVTWGKLVFAQEEYREVRWRGVSKNRDEVSNTDTEAVKFYTPYP